MSAENRTISVAVGRPGAENGSHRVAPGAEVVTEARGYHTPLIDIHEGPEGLVLEADLPGASEETVSIQLEDNVLSLHAKVGPTAPEGTRALHEEYRPAD